MHYTGQVYRHPIEAATPLLEVTAGCSHNKCSFLMRYNRTTTPNNNNKNTLYNFTSVNVAYNDNNGKKQISLNGNTAITEELLVQNTKNLK